MSHRCELLDRGTLGYTSGAWINNCTTTMPTTVDIDSLIATMKEFQAKQKQTDDDMLDALKRHIGVSGESLPVWAKRFGLPFVEFMETLHGLRPVSHWFWEGLRRVFSKDV